MMIGEALLLDLKGLMMTTEEEVVEEAEVVLTVAVALTELASNATKKVTWQENALMKETQTDLEVAAVEEELATSVIKKDIWLESVLMKIHHPITNLNIL